MWQWLVPCAVANYFYYVFFFSPYFSWIVCIAHNNLVVVATVYVDSCQLHRRTHRLQVDIKRRYFILTHAVRDRRKRAQKPKNNGREKSAWKRRRRKFQLGRQFKLDNLQATNLRWKQLELGQGCPAQSRRLRYKFLHLLVVRLAKCYFLCWDGAKMMVSWPSLLIPPIASLFPHSGHITRAFYVFDLR